MPHLEADSARFGGVIASLARQSLAGRSRDQENARHNWTGDEQAPPPPLPTESGLAPWQIKRVRKYVDAHLEEQMSLQTVAHEVRLGPRHFSRTFRKSFGQPFMQFVASQRVARAQRMMIATDFRLSEIAAVCGFADQAHFSRAFHRHAGETPARWRRKALTALLFRFSR